MSDIWDVRAPYSDDDTSKEAAEALEPSVIGRLRRAVLEFIRSRDNGATDEEIQEALGLDGDTGRPRRWELRNLGLVEDSGMRRKTTAGRNAVVWVSKKRASVPTESK